MWHIPQGHCLCPCGGTSVLELPSSFVYVSEKGGAMKSKKLAVLLLLGCVFVPKLEAQIKHIEMRVEGMT